MVVTWQPPTGGPVASYAVAASDGTSLVVPGGELQALFTGLKLGFPYTFTVTAVGKTVFMKPGERVGNDHGGRRAAAIPR